MKPRSSSFSALYFTFLIALLPLTLQASGTSDFGDNAPAQQEEGAIDTQEKISAYIEHHIKDAHDFHLFSYNDSEGHRKHVGFPLPVIVYTSQGVRAFMSSAFHHDDSGHYIVEKEGVSLVKYHEKIYELNQGEDQLSFDADHHPENAHAVLDLSMTKSVFGFLLVSLLLLFGFRSLANQYKKRSIPVGFGRVL